ncbi:hypothetical protein FRC11_014501 [Ceratobasidium sp. 423]|nr:hypothetical protein FRC11_014501 [Ceratobasidium sp. 423]
MLASLEKRTAQLKATLGKTRNLISVPINLLPDEILNRIFHFVADTQSTCFDKLVDEDKLPLDSLAISQMCSRWRQVALDSQSLWSHISLSARNELIPLGTLFAARSGNLPLSIRVVEQSGAPEMWSDVGLDRFFEGVGPRLKSIELAVVPSKFPALKSGLIRCVPGQLTRLVISDRNIYVDEELPDGYYDSWKYWFLIPHDSPPPMLRILNPRRRPKHVELDIRRQDLENILLHIKVLRLDRVYPVWTSKAYHGLVELRLIGPPQLIAIITEKQFSSILAASPGLRVLHFGLEMIMTGASPDPVRLEELEEFQLQSLLFDTQQTVLRLILPGTKPLRMSTTYNEDKQQYLPSLVEDEFCRFFARSNIVQFQVHSDRLQVRPPILLALLPNLQTLVFRQVDLEELAPSFHETPTTPICPRLRELHFISCGIDLDTLRWLVHTHNLQKVVVWGSAIREDTGNRSIVNISDIPVDIHPVVQVLDTSGYRDAIKVEGWGEDIEGRMATASLKDYLTY